MAQEKKNALDVQVGGWRVIEGEPGYEVSFDGQVRSWKPKRNNAPNPSEPSLLKPGEDKDGYKRVRLYQKERGAREYRLAVLVCTAWSGPRPDGKVVRHLDGNNTNDTASNLVWGTPLENARDSVEHGVQVKGEEVNTAKLTEAVVREIRQKEGRIVDIAKEFGVSFGTVSHIKNRRTWKHVE